MSIYGLIWAQSANGIIGRQGTIPWHLPEDQAHFKHLTMGYAVLMGRATWESLPPRYRPLPGRDNIVITHQRHYPAPGAQVITNLDQLNPTQSTWVIGGEQLYRLTLKHAQYCEVTEIDLYLPPCPGDTHSVSLGKDWQKTSTPWQESSTGLRYRFCHYQRTC